MSEAEEMVAILEDGARRLCRFLLTTSRGVQHYVDHLRQDGDGWWFAVTLCGETILASSARKPKYRLGIAYDPACVPCIEAALDTEPLTRSATEPPVMPMRRD